VDAAHITFALDDELETGVFRIRSTAAKRPADAASPVLPTQETTPQDP
jgi:hypothetical protein